MGIGHVALAFASKRFVPQVSLGWLVLATMLVDELFAVFVLLGVERARIVPGATEAYPFVLVHYPVTHSLVGGLGWALLLGLGWFAVKRDRAGAIVLGAAVISHWFLDVVAHTPDVPVLPNGPFLGLGLWNSLPATLIVEAVLVGVAIASYAASTRARDRIGSVGLWLLGGAILAIHAGVYLAPPPPNMTAAAWGMLGLILPVLATHWIDRHRAPLTAGAAAAAPAR
jgi:hypothetical protein